MAWTTPTSLDCIAESNIQIVMEELKTALFQRQDALGMARSTGWSTSDHVATRMGNYFDTLIQGIAGLGSGGMITLTPHTGGGTREYFVNDDLSLFSGTGWYVVKDLVALAGLTWDNTAKYISGDTTSGSWPNFVALIHRRETWTHIQLLFDYLKTYRRLGVSITFNETTRRVGGPNSNAETAWDDAKAATPAATSHSYAKWLNYFDGRAPNTPAVFYTFEIFPTSIASFDLSGFSEAINGEVLKLTAEISKAQNSRVMVDVQYSILFGAESWTLPAFTTTSGSETYEPDPSDVTAALGGELIRSIYINTTEPADHWANHSGLDTAIDYYITSSMTWPAVSEYIYFDLTSAMTYG